MPANNWRAYRFQKQMSSDRKDLLTLPDGCLDM